MLLKASYTTYLHDTNEPHEVVVWIDGVTSVTALGSGFYRSHAEVRERHGDDPIAVYAYLAHDHHRPEPSTVLSGIVDSDTAHTTFNYAECSPVEPEPVRLVQLMLMKGEAWEFVLVMPGRCWLLNDAGNTIDRI